MTLDEAIERYSKSLSEDEVHICGMLFFPKKWSHAIRCGELATRAITNDRVSSWLNWYFSFTNHTFFCDEHMKDIFKAYLQDHPYLKVEIEVKAEGEE